MGGTATKIMLFAMFVALIGRWANNETAVPSAKGLLEIVFALIVISALDQGETEPIAKGFAWIFLAAILLSNNSPITGIAKATGATPSTAKTVK